MAPHTPMKESSHNRDTLGLTWFPYPTPGGRLPNRELDEGTSINLWDYSSSSDEETAIKSAPEDSEFVVEDDELLEADESYAPTTPSSDNEDHEDKDASPKQQGSKKRNISPACGSVKRRRLFVHGPEATTELDYIKVESGASQNAASNGAELLAEFTTGRRQAIPGQHFTNLKADNREVHAFSGIEFPPELFAALDEVCSQIRDAARGFSSDVSLPGPGKLYMPAEENNFAAPHTKMLNATPDLELANEIALARFRDLCYEHFPAITTEYFDVFEHGPGDGWLNARGAIHELAKFAWWVERGCVCVSAAMPGTERQVAVRVIVRRVVPRAG